jgi:hypothetical protein
MNIITKGFVKNKFYQFKDGPTQRCTEVKGNQGQFTFSYGWTTFCDWSDDWKEVPNPDLKKV